MVDIRRIVGTGGRYTLYCRGRVEDLHHVVGGRIKDIRRIVGTGGRYTACYRGGW